MLVLLLLVLNPYQSCGTPSKITVITSVAIPITLVIDSPPQPFNASLNSTAIFTCICRDCSVQLWLVNNISASNQINKGISSDGPYLLSNGSRLYTLEVTASAELNGSFIQCQVYQPTVKSSVVKLLVQGKTLID